MSIRLKIILVVLPLLIVTILLVGITSALSARSGITRVAIEALGFKAQELQKYADNQWDLLVTNNLAENADYLAVTRRAVESYAGSLIRSESEFIFAVDAEGRLVMTTDEVDLRDPTEIESLSRRASQSLEGWQRLTIDGQPRVLSATPRRTSIRRFGRSTSGPTTFSAERSSSPWYSCSCSPVFSRGRFREWFVRC